MLRTWHEYTKAEPSWRKLRIVMVQSTKNYVALLLETAHTDAGIYRDHLHRYLWTLQQYPKLIAAFQEVFNLTTPVVIEQMQAFKLNSMGLVNLCGNYVTLTCNLYRQYFNE